MRYVLPVTLLAAFAVAGSALADCACKPNKPCKVHHKTKAKTKKKVQKKVLHKKHHSGQHHQPVGLGALGRYPETQDATGTTWVPASSPQSRKDIGNGGDWRWQADGTARVGYTDAGGRRGDNEWYGDSLVAITGTRFIDDATLQIRTMFSLDALVNGQDGKPSLFQTGGMDDRRRLRDRERPNDFFSELAMSFSTEISRTADAFLYLGLVGQPALGAGKHEFRPSGFEHPEDPIGDDYWETPFAKQGVITAGVTFNGTFKIEASAFNGRENNDNYYDVDLAPMDSFSGRVTYNPNENWSFSAALAYLKEPRFGFPGLDEHRLTASAMYNMPMGENNLAFGLYFGRKLIAGAELDGWALETTYGGSDGRLFARYEDANKNDLVGLPGEHRIHKFTVGGVYNLGVRNGYEYGVGVYTGFYSMPDSLERFYGRNPVTVGAFFRVRTGGR